MVCNIVLKGQSTLTNYKTKWKKKKEGHDKFEGAKIRSIVDGVLD